jgi:hypothetical protein
MPVGEPSSADLVAAASKLTSKGGQDSLLARTLYYRQYLGGVGGWVGGWVGGCVCVWGGANE